MKAAETMAGALLIGTLFISVQGQELIDPRMQERVGDWNPNWDYKQNGADWNFTNCNNSRQQQSPIDLKSSDLDWYHPPKNSMGFTFLPTYKPTVLSKIDDKTNYTYTVYGDFG